MDKATVVVLGASSNPERYSNQAVRLLKDYGCHVIPVNPGGGEIYGLSVVKSLGEIAGQVHTLTLYVNPAISGQAGPSILALHPERVIFNPGTENPGLEELCRSNGIKTERACTLVLLRTGQF